MVSRTIENQIKADLFRGKAIILYGPRQVGKTTLVNKIMESFQGELIYFTGDEPDDRELLENVSSTRLKALAGKKKIMVIDEAQRIPNIGLSVKLAVDKIPGLQVVVTGSSSFFLSDVLNEPLTGRKYEYFLFPFSFAELASHTNMRDESRLLEHRLIYGYYPEIVNNAGEEERLLGLLTDNYLFKDLFTYEKIKKPALLTKLLKAIALQLGSEVSFLELSRTIGADKETVERYIDLLEKSFVIFQLPSFSRNLRNELKKSKKIYFLDNGIRNALISNFNSPGLRQDTGSLWENFLISERWKYLMNSGKRVNRYFWRTAQQQEINYIEETGGTLSAYEFKWKNASRPRIPKTFISAYPDSECKVVDVTNFTEFVI